MDWREEKKMPGQVKLISHWYRTMQRCYDDPSKTGTTESMHNDKTSQLDCHHVSMHVGAIKIKNGGWMDGRKKLGNWQ